MFRVAGDTSSAERERAAFSKQLAGWKTAHDARNIRTTARETCGLHRYELCARLLQSQTHRTPEQELLLGQAFTELHQDDRASDAFATALAQENDNPKPAYWLLRTYKRLADECFARLSQSFPNSWRVHQLKAEAYRLRDDPKQAIDEYRLAAKMKPDDPSLHEALGDLYLLANSLPEAQSEIEQSLKLNPTGARSLYLMGRLHVAERKPAEGIPYLRNALHRDPGLLEARVVLGKAYLRTGKAELAVPELEKAVVLDHYGDLHFLLYQAYRDLGKTGLAQQAMARSQSLRRASAAADQAKLAKAYEEQ